MARSNYDEALRRVLGHEGGYVNHPRDPGGETNYGITVAVARQNGYAGPMRDIPMEVVKRIYKAKYWDALRCDELPAGVDYAAFDYGVNSGVGRSGKVLRRVTGLPDDSHVVTPAVLEAVRRRDPALTVQAICDERMAFLKRLSTWDTFGKGWSRRVAEVRAAGLTMARRKSAAEEQSGVPQPAPGKAQDRGEAPKPSALQSIVAAFAALFTKRG
ncbi:MAG: hypothetical protein FJX62_13210 [Alphaproteobacteria bacterium]|nr:hypothetical protein [Alphaproteobacteria bacterium]